MFYKYQTPLSSVGILSRRLEKKENSDSRFEARLGLQTLPNGPAVASMSLALIYVMRKDQQPAIYPVYYFLKLSVPTTLLLTLFRYAWYNVFCSSVPCDGPGLVTLTTCIGAIPKRSRSASDDFCR